MIRVASPVPSSDMGSADRAREYADMLEAVDLFNGEYLKGVESPRRPMLLARLKACLPVLEETLVELRAVGVGERRRYAEACDRFRADHPGMLPMDVDVLDDVDAVTAGVWDCCEALASEGGRECECCGHRGIPTNSLDDVTAIVRELIGLLESSGTHTGVYDKQ